MLPISLPSVTRRLRKPIAALRRSFGPPRAFMREERRAVRALGPLLRKRRLRRWSRADRAKLKAHLRLLWAASPVLLVLVLPGGFLLLPVLAWWLDRRRRRAAPARRRRS